MTPPATPENAYASDPTLYWDPNVERLWLDGNNTSQKRPPAQILLTNVGWNNPANNALLVPRSLRETWLFEGVINHPWFLPTGWQDIESGVTQVDPSVLYYVFMDFFQCYDHHWPHYGAPIGTNMDERFGRNNPWRDKGTNEQDKQLLSIKDKKLLNMNCFTLGLSRCRWVYDLLFSSRLFQNAPKNVRLVYLDCTAWAHDIHPPQTKSLPVSVIVMEVILAVINADKDMGLPPPAVTPVTLSKQQIEQIHDTKNCPAEYTRRLFLTYWGNFRSGPEPHFRARSGLRQFHNEGQHILILDPEVGKHRSTLQRYLFCCIL